MLDKFLLGHNRAARGAAHLVHQAESLQAEPIARGRTRARTCSSTKSPARVTRRRGARARSRAVLPSPAPPSTRCDAAALARSSKVVRDLRTVRVQHPTRPSTRHPVRRTGASNARAWGWAGDSRSRRAAGAVVAARRHRHDQLTKPGRCTHSTPATSISCGRCDSISPAIAGAAFSLGSESGGVIDPSRDRGRDRPHRGRDAARHALVGVLSLGLVLGGALGNPATDAPDGSGFLGGAVIDFIDSSVAGFNVEDMALTIGGVAPRPHCDKESGP